MKWILKIFSLSLLLQSFECSDPKAVEDTNSNNLIVTPESLKKAEQEIQNYINSFPCSETAGCGFIAFGDKPCGGPRKYLLFSNSVDLVKLKQMVNTYNEADNAYNIKTGAISDCMYAMPPTEVKCVNGVCTIIK